MSSDESGTDASSTRRRKKRGSGGHYKTQDGAAPSHLHLMYREEDESASPRDQEDEERDVSDA